MADVLEQKKSRFPTIPPILCGNGADVKSELHKKEEWGERGNGIAENGLMRALHAALKRKKRPWSARRADQGLGLLCRVGGVQAAAFAFLLAIQITAARSSRETGVARRAAVPPAK